MGLFIACYSGDITGFSGNPPITPTNHPIVQSNNQKVKTFNNQIGDERY